MTDRSAGAHVTGVTAQVVSTIRDANVTQRRAMLAPVSTTQAPGALAGPEDTRPVRRVPAVDGTPAPPEGEGPRTDASTGRVARPGPGGRGYRLAVAALLAVQVAIALVVSGQSYFFADDFFYGSILTAEPLSLNLMFRSWFGHLGPGYILADWFFYDTFGTDWTVAVVVMVLVQVAGTVALLRLLTALRGRRASNVAVTALVVLSLELTTQTLWWGAVLSNLVPLVATVVAMDFFVRWDRSRRILPFLAMVVAFGVAVAFIEKSVLAAAYIGLLSLLVLDADVPWRQRWGTTLRRWPAWMALAAIAGIDLAIFVTGDYIAESQEPGLRQLAAFLFLSFTEGLVPSLFGFLPSSLTGAGGIAVLVATNAVVLAVVVGSSLRSPRALQAWIFFALGYLLNQGALGRGRVAMLGEHMGTLLRYQLENIVLFAIALAVALPALLRPAGRRLQAGGPVLRRSVAVVAVLALAGLLVPWTAGVRHEMAVSSGTATRGYVETFRETLAGQRRAEPELGFLAGDTVPGWMVYTQMAPYNRFDRVLPQIDPDVRFVDDADRVLTVAEQGEVGPAEFRPAAEVPLAGRCLDGAEPAATAWLSEPLPEGTWSLRLVHRATGPGTVTLTVDNDVPGDGLRMAAEPHAVDPASDRLVAIAGSLPVAKVTVAWSGPGRLCLDALDIGTFEPASPGIPAPTPPYPSAHQERP